MIQYLNTENIRKYAKHWNSKAIVIMKHRDPQ